MSCYRLKRTTKGVDKMNTNSKMILGAMIISLIVFITSSVLFGTFQTIFELTMILFIYIMMAYVLGLSMLMGGDKK